MKLLTKTQELFSGKKGYILGIVAVVWAVVGYAIGYIDAKLAQEVAWAGLTTIALRAGMKKI